MNSEKQITITDLKGKFTKDFDTFGKMDPFLEFRVGKCSARTETHNNGGKEPAWINPVVLTYFDELNISIQAFDEDVSENEFIGTAKIQIKSLKFPGGLLEANFLADSGEVIGSVTAKYTLKNLPTVPLLIIKNVKCDFVKEHSFISKSKPFIEFRSEEGSVSSDPKDESKDLVFAWSEVLRLKIKDGSKFTIHLKDKNDKDNCIFTYECSVKEFKFQSGFKRFNVFDQSFFMLGTVQFDFETFNLVSKEESAKNVEKQKKSECELTSIFIETAKLDLALEGKDIYMRLIIGANSITTDVIKDIPKTLSLDIKKNIYAEAKQSKVAMLIWEKNILKDKIIGVAVFPLEGLTSGDKKVTFMDKEQKGEVGTGSFSITTKQTSLKVFSMEAIAISFVEGGDLLGQSEPYVVARIGGWQGRTETGDQNRISFKKGVEVKFNDEQTLQLQVWDQDVVNDEILYAQKVSLSEFKTQKGEMSLPLHLKENDKPVKKGKISFKYELKINALQNQNLKKPSQRKLAQPKIQEPKIPQKEVKNNKSQVKLPQKINSETAIVPERKKSTIEVQHISDLTNPQNNRQEGRMGTEHSSPNKSNYKAKQTPNLPSIVSSRVNFGDRIFDKQSSATLQTSIHVYSMPKGPRFINQPKYSGEPSYCMDSCFKSNSTKGVGFGYGRKKQFPDWMQRNMKQNPAPGAYLLSNSSSSDIRTRGPTFGISHKHYEKVLIARQKLKPSHRLSPIRQGRK